MAEIDQIQVGNNTYDICDSTARQRTIPSGGSTGQYLKKKSATNYDTEWGNIDSPTVEMYNSSLVTTISAGTIVTAALNYDSNGYSLRMIPAGKTSSGQLYVLSENCPPQTSVQCYYAPGTVCPVLCDTDAVALGDILGGAVGSKCHSLEPSASTALPLGRATVGIALEAKASGSDGMVMTRLVDNPTTTADKENDLQTEYGTCFMVTDNAGYYIKVAPVTKGKIPFGVQANKELTGGLLLHTHQNEQVAVLADETEIRVGDWLVPSATMDGHVRNGTGYGVGEALTSKVAGSSGLVKVHLNLKYGISPRAWWLPSGINEDQVIAAWQFIDRASETEALLNVNNGTEYPLTKNSNDIIWYQSKGFYFPSVSKENKLLQNANVFALAGNLFCAAFGFSEVDITTSNRVAVGIAGSTYRVLQVRGYGYDGTYRNFPVINRNTSTYNLYSPANKYSEGVLGGNWKDVSEMFYNGQKLSISENGASWHSLTANGTGIGLTSSSQNATSGYITACVLYSTNLTASQHLELANNIRALGGVG